MNKASIKVIKRKEREETQGAFDAGPSIDKGKNERNSRREIVETVSTWINERRENNRHEEIAAIRKIFGNEPLLNEI